MYISRHFSSKRVLAVAKKRTCCKKTGVKVSGRSTWREIITTILRVRSGFRNSGSQRFDNRDGFRVEPAPGRPGHEQTRGKG